MDTKTNYLSFDIIEDLLIEQQMNSKKGEKFTEELYNILSEYITRHLRKYRFPEWYTLYKKDKKSILIARIIRSILEKIAWTEEIKKDRKVFSFLNKVISEYIKNSIDKQKTFDSCIILPDNTIKGIQNLPKTPLKGDHISYEEKEYVVDYILWDIDNGTRKIKVKNNN